MFFVCWFLEKERVEQQLKRKVAHDVKYVKQNKNINGRRRRRHKHVRTCNASDLYNFIHLFSIRNGVFLYFILLHRSSHGKWRPMPCRESSPQVHFLTSIALASRTVTAEYLFQSFFSRYFSMHFPCDWAYWPYLHVSQSYETPFTVQIVNTRLNRVETRRRKKIKWNGLFVYWICSNRNREKKKNTQWISRVPCSNGECANCTSRVYYVSDTTMSFECRLHSTEVAAQLRVCVVLLFFLFTFIVLSVE